jgi:hypothetical protein
MAYLGYRQERGLYIDTATHSASWYLLYQPSNCLCRIGMAKFQYNDEDCGVTEEAGAAQLKEERLYS